MKEIIILFFKRIILLSLMCFLMWAFWNNQIVPGFGIKKEIGLGVWISLTALVNLLLDFFNPLWVKLIPWGRMFISGILATAIIYLV